MTMLISSTVMATLDAGDAGSGTTGRPYFTGPDTPRADGTARASPTCPSYLGKRPMMGDFISGDWGTSRLRLRLMRGSPLEVLAEVQADRGIAATYQEWHASGALHDREPFYLQA